MVALDVWKDLPTWTQGLTLTTAVWNIACHLLLTVQCQQLGFFNPLGGSGVTSLLPSPLLTWSNGIEEKGMEAQQSSGNWA